MQEQFLKELDTHLKAISGKLSEELRAIRGNRPSVEMIEDVKVNYYDQEMPIKQLGSLSILPPRGIQVNVWDKNAVGAVTKAIENSKRGFSVSSDGNNIIASIPPLMAERREELSKLVKKTAENSRIQVRHHRDEFIKKLSAKGGSASGGKDGEAKNKLTEDEVFKAKEKAQKNVDAANKQIEDLVGSKLKELEE